MLPNKIWNADIPFITRRIVGFKCGEHKLISLHREAALTGKQNRCPQFSLPILLPQSHTEGIDFGK